MGGNQFKQEIKMVDATFIINVASTIKFIKFEIIVLIKYLKYCIKFYEIVYILPLCLCFEVICVIPL